MSRFQNTRQPDWDWWGKLWPTPGETLRDFGLSSGETVVEIGCGDGYFALPAARIVDPGTVYALDLEASLLSELEAIAEQQQIENVVPLEGDARSLADHLPESVDVAVIANTFHGVDDPTPLVEEIADVLVEDGSFIVVNWRDRPKETTTVDGEARGPPTELRLAPDATRAAVEAASELTLTEAVDIPPYHYALCFDR
ncbi:class I SAM-dependent methyltransferase [Natronolimnohabitans innermongolicus]|uniref:S-adenosylmethionine-dependent methyltransferase-like protein n=1 Tax=Natronolimnohabitans innermongolicus JCM 12255 TaxID=1227499 RepID=L9WYA4_9EURY|nr:class I SAM-dependent methyltransferase [Natronolimnohabitans innermongolicus]ELY54445.1 S-adenosylmethionine-dependent methyltransferase-like protein [Natronolimnohabitans innermongolicus JCM 12255]